MEVLKSYGHNTGDDYPLIPVVPGSFMEHPLDSLRKQLDLFRTRLLNELAKGNPWLPDVFHPYEAASKEKQQMRETALAAKQQKATALLPVIPEEEEVIEELPMEDLLSLLAKPEGAPLGDQPPPRFTAAYYAWEDAQKRKTEGEV
jgi:hypothetical protein